MLTLLSFTEHLKWWKNNKHMHTSLSDILDSFEVGVYGVADVKSSSKSLQMCPVFTPSHLVNIFVALSRCQAVLIKDVRFGS